MPKKYTGKTPFTLPRPLFYKNGVNKEDINAPHTLTYYDSQWQLLNDTTNTVGLVITLPAKKNGAWLCIKNKSAGGSFSVKDADGVVISGIPATESALYVCDGDTWWLTIG